MLCWWNHSATFANEPRFAREFRQEEFRVSESQHEPHAASGSAR